MGLIKENPNSQLKIAVIGSGISGLSAAWLLNQKHSVTVYEANDYIGGHTNTIEIVDNGQMVAVDTGFIVYNEPAYPNPDAFIRSSGRRDQCNRNVFFGIPGARRPRIRRKWT